VKGSQYYVPEEIATGDSYEDLKLTEMKSDNRKIMESIKENGITFFCLKRGIIANKSPLTLVIEYDLVLRSFPLKTN